MPNSKEDTAPYSFEFSADNLRELQESDKTLSKVRESVIDSSDQSKTLTSLRLSTSREMGYSTGDGHPQAW